MPDAKSKAGATDYDASVAGRSVTEVLEDLMNAVRNEPGAQGSEAAR